MNVHEGKTYYFKSILKEKLRNEYFDISTYFFGH